MDNSQFQVYKTKVEGITERFDLNDPASRQKYFEAKAGSEIQKLRKFLENNTFVSFLLGKKNSGKGTYSKQFIETVDKDRVGHLSVGDIVRDIHEVLETTETAKEKLIDFLKTDYRGFHSIEETIDLIMGRSQSNLMSSELILSLIKYEISKRPKQAIFIDGFPRALDQVNYSLFLKELIGYRDDPDFFVFINVPTSIIDERIKYRVVCPICKTPRNVKLLATKEVGYDQENKSFYLICDNPSCDKARMVPKEGDELGVDPIRKRLEMDEQIFKQLLQLTGIPKIFLRNSVPVDLVKDNIDDYEITPEYQYELDPETQKVKVIEKQWIIKDDEGIESYSLMPAAVVVSLIKQMVKVLDL
ncbi:MAG: nucleoside monophosphate kinase [bacterium]|nr:nucleoside monophosphate kinase [bacterium]